VRNIHRKHDNLEWRVFIINSGTCRVYDTDILTMPVW